MQAQRIGPHHRRRADSRIQLRVMIRKQRAQRRAISDRVALELRASPQIRKLAIRRADLRTLKIVHIQIRQQMKSRLQLDQNPEAQIGIIVPNLTTLRPKVDRIFRETLHPGLELDDRARSFHLSLGPPLAEYPLIRTALLMLEFGLGPLTLPRAGMLLRSSFLGGAETEARLAAEELRLPGGGPPMWPMWREPAGSR